MIDYANHIASEEAHTVKLARIPGCQDYIRHKAKGMARKYPELYAQLPALVEETITATNQENSDVV